MKNFTSPTQRIGELGERIAVRFLMKRGYGVIECNYTRKWGEIDIIAKHGEVIYFIEVKSRTIVSDETSKVNWARENMTFHKKHKMKRTIEIALKDRRFRGKDFKIGIIFVSFRLKDRVCRVEYLDDVLLTD